MTSRITTTIVQTHRIHNEWVEHGYVDRAILVILLLIKETLPIPGLLAQKH